MKDGVSVGVKVGAGYDRDDSSSCALEESVASEPRGLSCVRGHAAAHPVKRLVIAVVVLLVAVMVVSGVVVRELVRAPEVDLTGGLVLGRMASEQDDERVAADTITAYAVKRHAEADYEAAIRAYDTLLDQDPYHTDALFGRGIALLAVGRTEEGEESLKRALSLDARHAGAAYALGLHYFAAGRYEDVVRVVEPTIVNPLGVADTATLLGAAYERMGQTAKAESYYRKALEHVPDAPLALEGLSRIGVEP